MFAELPNHSLLTINYGASHRNKLKRAFVSTSNEALVGTLTTIGDVNDIFNIEQQMHGNFQLKSQGYKVRLYMMVPSENRC